LVRCGDETLRTDLKRSARDSGDIASICYNNHPRTFLVAHGNSVQRVDARETQSSQEVCFIAGDRESVSVVEKAVFEGATSFGVCIATSQQLLLHDVRSGPTKVLASYSYDLQAPPSFVTQNRNKIAICGSRYEDLLVLRCSKSGSNNPSCTLQHGRLEPTDIDQTSLIGETTFELGSGVRLNETFRLHSDLASDWSTKYSTPSMSTAGLAFLDEKFLCICFQQVILLSKNFRRGRL